MLRMNNQVRFIRAVRARQLDLTRKAAVIEAQLDADGYDRLLPSKARKVRIILNLANEAAASCISCAWTRAAMRSRSIRRKEEIKGDLRLLYGNSSADALWSACRSWRVRATRRAMRTTRRRRRAAPTSTTCSPWCCAR